MASNLHKRKKCRGQFLLHTVVALTVSPDMPGRTRVDGSALTALPLQGFMRFAHYQYCPVSVHSIESLCLLIKLYPMFECIDLDILRTLIF